MRLFFATLLLLPCFASAESREETLNTGPVPLVGTIELPESGSPAAVVLMVAGSGPTDRDGNSLSLPGKNNSLKLLAHALLAANIASLRYDKRLVGASASDEYAEDDLTFDLLVDDARGWIAWLKRHFDVPIFVLGHSEGALIGMLAANSSDVDGVISIAGPASRASELIIRQVSGRIPNALLVQVREIVGELEEGRRAASPPAELNALFRESVQPYLISWFQYDPQSVAADLKKPLLLVYGTTDIQVALQAGELLKAANPAASLVIVDGMNHVLKTVGDDMQAQVRSYGDPSLPLAPALAPAIVGFIADQVR